MIALTDETQGVRRVYAYDDWGNDAGTGGFLAAPNADRARWKGALWLGPELDVYYMRNRWYEPATGRFLSEDPIGLQGGINPLMFGGADPVNRRDPDGLKCTVQPVFRLNADGTDSEDVIGEKLVCKDIGFGDLSTIRAFLGGELGDKAAAAFRGIISASGGSIRGTFGFGRKGGTQTLGTMKTREQCSIYSEGGSLSGRGLDFLCSEVFPDDPFSQRMRGCLQALYNPNSGYVRIPTPPGGLPYDVDGALPGTAAHLVCLANASGLVP